LGTLEEDQGRRRVRRAAPFQFDLKVTTLIDCPAEAPARVFS
jgi:hypothetical protein